MKTLFLSLAAQAPSDLPEVDEQWGLTPDVILIVAAAVMTLGVMIFVAFLFARANREEKELTRQQRRSGA